jgi:RES domain-containing protein
VYAVSFNEALLEDLPIASLPAGWNSEPPTAASQSLGDAWVLAARSAVLAVPSVIVPEERNYVLNPNHPRFAEVQIASPVPCAVDPRLL